MSWMRDFSIFILVVLVMAHCAFLANFPESYGAVAAKLVKGYNIEMAKP